MINQSFSGIPFCSNCKVALDEEQSKEHYKTEFHRYNIKRKLANLQPVSESTFNDKKEKLINQSQITIQRQEKFVCEPCGKSFKNDETLNQHLSSKKHKDQKNQQTQIKPKTEVPKGNALNDQNVCLFCDQINSSIENNLIHMRNVHSFFISEQNYCKNIEGLLKYLAQKINKGLLCLYCENKGHKEFKSSEALKDHMMDKGHCFMNTEYFDEYKDFYDFSEQLKELDAMNYSKSKKFEEHEMEIVSDSDEDSEWSEAEYDENDEKEEFRDQMVKTKKKRQIIRFRKAKLMDNGEVLLPNGKLIGNRQYRVFYKQAVRNTGINQTRFKALMGQNYENRIAQMKNLELNSIIVKKKMLFQHRIQNRIQHEMVQNQKHFGLTKNLDLNKLIIIRREYQNYG